MVNMWSQTTLQQEKKRCARCCHRRPPPPLHLRTAQRQQCARHCRSPLCKVALHPRKKTPQKKNDSNTYQQACSSLSPGWHIAKNKTKGGLPSSSCSSSLLVLKVLLSSRRSHSSSSANSN
jgi:hypothetical protein